MLETAILLAQGAGVSLDWMVGSTGRISLRAPIDRRLLEESVEAAIEGIVELELDDLPMSTKAEIAADIYATCHAERHRPERKAVMKIIKSAA